MGVSPLLLIQLYFSVLLERFSSICGHERLTASEQQVKESE